MNSFTWIETPPTVATPPTDAKIQYESPLRTLREVHQPARLFEEGWRGLRCVGPGGVVKGRRAAGGGTRCSGVDGPDGGAGGALSGEGEGHHLAVHGRGAEF